MRYNFCRPCCKLFHHGQIIKSAILLSAIRITSVNIFPDDFKAQDGRFYTGSFHDNYIHPEGPRILLFFWNHDVGIFSAIRSFDQIDLDKYLARIGQTVEITIEENNQNG